MCASALPGENGAHNMRWNKPKTLQNIHDIIDCNSKKENQILIVFRTGIPDTTGHPMTL